MNNSAISKSDPGDNTRVQVSIGSNAAKNDLPRHCQPRDSSYVAENELLWWYPGAKSDYPIRKEEAEKIRAKRKKSRPVLESAPPLPLPVPSCSFAYAHKFSASVYSKTR